MMYIINIIIYDYKIFKGNCIMLTRKRPSTAESPLSSKESTAAMYALLYLRRSIASTINQKPNSRNSTCPAESTNILNSYSKNSKKKEK